MECELGEVGEGEEGGEGGEGGDAVGVEVEGGEVGEGAEDVRDGGQLIVGQIEPVQGGEGEGVERRCGAEGEGREGGEEESGETVDRFQLVVRQAQARRLTLREQVRSVSKKAGVWGGRRGAEMSADCRDHGIGRVVHLVRRQI